MKGDYMEILYFFISIIWTNIPIFYIGYHFINAINKGAKKYFFVALIGLLAYFIYLLTIYLYLKDNRLQYFIYIVKIASPIYIIYLMLGAFNNNYNRIFEAAAIILIFLFLGIVKVYN